MDVTVISMDDDNAGDSDLLGDTDVHLEEPFDPDLEAKVDTAGCLCDQYECLAESYANPQEYQITHDNMSTDPR